MAVVRFLSGVEVTQGLIVCQHFEVVFIKVAAPVSHDFKCSMELALTDTATWLMDA